MQENSGIRTEKYSCPEGMLVRGESIEAMRMFARNSFDVIYADPPFFTNTVRNGGKRTGRQLQYSDEWSGIGEYIRWLSPRLRRCRELLRDTGTMFLHLDWHAAHYAKVEMDRVFGHDNFLNEIIWYYKTGGTSRRHFSRKHDTLLFYAKTADYSFYPVKERSYLMHRYGFSNITILKDEEGLFREAYCRDVWDIPAIRGNQPQNTGYPSQKPEALAERIILSTTREHDLVGDFFCGSGTVASVAARMGRRWAAFDSSDDAFDISRRRLCSIYACGTADDLKHLECNQR